MPPTTFRPLRSHMTPFFPHDICTHIKQTHLNTTHACCTLELVSELAHAGTVLLVLVLVFVLGFVFDAFLRPRAPVWINVAQRLVLRTHGAMRAALFGARPHKVLTGRGFLLFCTVSREGFILQPRAAGFIVFGCKLGWMKFLFGVPTSNGDHESPPVYAACCAGSLIFCG